MLAYIVRKLVYNIPVYLSIILLVMAALRVHDPVVSYLGKNARPEDVTQYREQVGLDRPFPVQYARFITSFDLHTESWDQRGRTVKEILGAAIGPSLALTVPSMILTTLLSVCIGLVASFYRGRLIDRLLMLGSVFGMSVSFLVYIILGQYFGAYALNQWLGHELFAIEGYAPGIVNWPRYFLLPVMISVIVGIGYDSRYYRAVMVEESQSDYVTTALAKGASRRKILFAHILKNAMLPIITRISITLPLLITGSILLENFFGIPGMGRTLIAAVRSNDFPVVQAFAAVFAAVYITSIILTDVLYAYFDPRVRLA